MFTPHSGPRFVAGVRHEMLWLANCNGLSAIPGLMNVGHNVPPKHFTMLWTQPPRYQKTSVTFLARHTLQRSRKGAEFVLLGWMYAILPHVSHSCSFIRGLLFHKRDNTCRGALINPHSCAPHPVPGRCCLRADDDTSGFKWPQDFEEAPAVPQKFTKERDISQLARTEVLNTFAGEKWIAERTMSAVKCCHTPSVEQTRALKEHLTTTAFLPRLILDPKEAKQSTKQKKKLPRWHADMTPADLRNLVCACTLVLSSALTC